MTKIRKLVHVIVKEFKDLHSVRRMMRGKESPKK